MTQTIGQKLKQAREVENLTLEQVFEAIRIRVPYLRALEEDDLSAMPSPVQARGYLRNYAEFLGLNVEHLLEEMRAEKKASDVIIGPADLTDEPETQTSESLSLQPAAPLSTPEPEPIIQTESPLDIAPSLEEIPLVKPKTTRRKKPDAQTASEPTTTKRRGRKKAEPEPEVTPVVEFQPEVVAELIPSVEPEPVKEPSIVEETVEPQPHPEATTKTDINEGLWQTWLNRVGTVISARRKNKGETQPQENLESDSLLSESERQTDETSQQEQPLTSTRAPAFLYKESIQIFKEIGIELRTRRELLSLNLTEVERNTHVKAHYLEALEHGEMDNLPSTVQTRGMLSNYATFLDLDVDTILLRYADALQARHREKNPQKPPRKAGTPIIANLQNLTNFIAGDMIFGVGMAILLVGFSIWGVSRVMTLQSEQKVEPTALSISDVLLASPAVSSITVTPTLEEIQIPGQPTETIVIPTLSGDANVQVNLVAVERTYLRVTVDGDVKFDGRVVPGNAYPFDAEDQIEILVGSGAAIRVVYNGQDLGLLGTFGQVVSTIYTVDEIITPTLPPTAIPTNTQTPSPTLPPSATPPPTRTPVPSNTPSQ